MKTNLTILIAVLLIMFSPAAYAQGGQNTCTNAASAGTYSVTCSGWTATPTGALVPIMQVGVATGDPDGNWSGTTTINIAGQTVIAGVKVTGKSIINPDCTGSITYNTGTPTELNITYVANPRSDDFSGLITDKGTVASCTLKRISK